MKKRGNAERAKGETEQIRRMGNGIRTVGMFPGPAQENIQNALDFRFGQRTAGWDSVPFLQTGSTAAAGCMLSGKAGMSAHWSLFPVVDRTGRSETLTDQFFALRTNRVESMFRNRAQFRWIQPEPGAETRSGMTAFQIFPFGIGDHTSARVSFLIHV